MKLKEKLQLLVASCLFPTAIIWIIIGLDPARSPFCKFVDWCDS